jgi:hypothetical protein
VPPIFRVLGPGVSPPPAFDAQLVGLAPTPLEIGADLVSPTFNASYSAVPTFAELSDDIPNAPQNVIGVPNPITRPFTYQKLLNGETVVFTLTANNGGPNSTPQVTYTWLPRVYWGLTANPGGPYTEGDVEALGNSALATGRARVFTLSPVNEYIVYAWPDGYGNANPLDFMIGPFPGGFVEDSGSPLLITANTPGAPAQLYRVWRSTNLLTGTPTVTVTVS